MYRLLGLHPGPDIHQYAAAALADISIVEARRLLDELAAAHLLQEPGHGQHTFHDLVRAHAAHAAQTEPERDRRAALDRLATWYLAAVESAMGLWRAYDGAAAMPMPDGLKLNSAIDARLWLISEQTNLIALAKVAGAAARSTSVPLAWHLVQLDLYEPARELFRDGARSSRDTGGRCLESHARRGLAEIARLTGQFGEAERSYRHALRLSRSADDLQGTADALRGMADIALATDRPHAARMYSRRALKVSRRRGDRLGEANALRRQGDVACVMGEAEAANKYQHEALAIYRELPDRRGEANALRGLGDVAHRAERYALAREHHHSALAIYQQLGGDRRGVASAMYGLGKVACSEGEHEEARELWQTSLEIYDQLGSPMAKEIRSALADLLHGKETSHGRRHRVPRCRRS